MAGRQECEGGSGRIVVQRLGGTGILSVARERCCTKTMIGLHERQVFALETR